MPLACFLLPTPYFLLPSYLSSTQGFVNVPMPSISTVTTSPCFKKIGGFLPMPTPGCAGDDHIAGQQAKGTAEVGDQVRNF